MELIVILEHTQLDILHQISNIINPTFVKKI